MSSVPPEASAILGYDVDISHSTALKTIKDILEKFPEEGSPELLTTFILLVGCLGPDDSTQLFEILRQHGTNRFLRHLFKLLYVTPLTPDASISLGGLKFLEKLFCDNASTDPEAGLLDRQSVDGVLQLIWKLFTSCDEESPIFLQSLKCLEALTSCPFYPDSKHTVKRDVLIEQLNKVREGTVSPSNLASLDALIHKLNVLESKGAATEQKTIDTPTATTAASTVSHEVSADTSTIADSTTPTTADSTVPPPATTTDSTMVDSPAVDPTTTAATSTTADSTAETTADLTTTQADDVVDTPSGAISTMAEEASTALTSALSAVSSAFSTVVSAVVSSVVPMETEETSLPVEGSTNEAKSDEISPESSEENTQVQPAVVVHVNEETSTQGDASLQEEALVQGEVSIQEETPAQEEVRGEVLVEGEVSMQGEAAFVQGETPVQEAASVQEEPPIHAEAAPMQGEAPAQGEPPVQGEEAPIQGETPSQGGEAPVEGEEAWAFVQRKTFTRWMNRRLSRRAMRIDNLYEGLQDGVMLCNLIEVCAGVNIGQWSGAPKSVFQKLRNVDVCLDYLSLKEHVKLVNVGASDIIEGNRRIILGLVWSVILHYDNVEIGDSNSTPRQALLDWVNHAVALYKDRFSIGTVTNFTSCFTDGRVLSALCDSFAPGIITAVDPDPLLATANALTLAEQKFDLPRFLDAEDIVNTPDEPSMMCYVNLYRELAGTLLRDVYPPKCSVEGEGVSRGAKGKTLHFLVITRSEDGRLTVCSDKQPLKIEISDPNGTPVECAIVWNLVLGYECSYLASELGDYTIRASVGGVALLQPQPIAQGEEKDATEEKEADEQSADFICHVGSGEREIVPPPSTGVMCVISDKYKNYRSYIAENGDCVNKYGDLMASLVEQDGLEVYSPADPPVFWGCVESDVC